MRMTLASAGIVVLLAAGVTARQLSPPGGQAGAEDDDHAHAGAVDHGTDPASFIDSSSHAFTLNVYVSDSGFEPSTVFVPGGQRVQLVLRNRGVDEHHYHVVGLVPRDLMWMSEPASGNPMAEDSDADHQMHHAREFVSWRGASPSGISPTGKEVHAYVSAARGVDVLLFAAADVGTFVVQCDLHPGEAGKMEVFDGGRNPTALISAAGGAQGSVRDPLSIALSRNLGTLESPGTPDVFLEATYAPAEYVTQLVGGPVAMPTPLEPDEYVAILLTEGVHAGRLPVRGESPALYVDGEHLPLIDSKVTTELPHHRATLYRFARDDAFGTKEQVMTLRLAPGHEATWELPAPSAGMWLLVVGGLAGFGFVGWLVWSVTGRTRPKRMSPETP